MNDTKKFTFLKTSPNSSAHYTSDVVNCISATLSSVADMWKAEVFSPAGSFADKSFPLSKYSDAVDFCNSEMRAYLAENLPWTESTVHCEGKIYWEWNYHSTKNEAHYKIYCNSDAPQEYNCLALVFSEGEFVAVDQPGSQPNLEAAQKFFFEYEGG